MTFHDRPSTAATDLWVPFRSSSTPRLDGELLDKARKLDLRYTEGIPHTGVERTLIDCGDAVSSRVLLDFIDTAIRKRLTSWSSLRRVLTTDARRGRNGCGTLRALVDKHETEASVPFSEWSRWSCDALVDAGLPKPQLEKRLCRDDGSLIAQVDLGYVRFPVVIELDGKEFHFNHESFARDPRKRTELTAAGYSVLVFTWDAWRDDRSGCIERSRQALSLHGWRPDESA